MKCPSCGSDRVFTCTDSLGVPKKRYFECVDCFYRSRKVPIYDFKCTDYYQCQSKWEIELNKLEQEWQ